MENKTSVLFVFIVVALLILSLSSTALKDEEETEFQTPSPFFVKKGERKTAVKTEDGEISTVRISDGISDGWYHIEFITLEPNSIFLPVLLQSDMVFYVHTGSGQISWTDEDETKQVELRRGDIFRLRPGTLFYIQSSLEMERQKLRIYALFANSENDLHEPETGPYTSIRKLVLGFDRVVLEAAFGVSGEPMEEMVSSPDPGAIVHGLSNEKKNTVKLFEFMKGILGGNSYSSILQSQTNKKKNKAYNIFSNDPDFENCNGWSTVVSKKEVSALKGIDVSVFMVNLTKGSMMGPHWNQRASEIGIGLHGPGMVRVVCSSAAKQTGCKNMRFHVEEGDVFAVPRFHPMAQMAFNNDSFVFMGFSTSKKNNHPQYLAGTASVLRTLPRDIVAISFGTTNTTTDQVLDKQKQAIILDCTSCAEEELRIMEEEIEKAKEEARKKEEEEKKRKEEEKKKEEEEEEAKRAQEEEARKEEEAREREAREREEEEEREKEEEARRAEEEEARKEEEARQREAREREEQEKEEEAERQKQEEEEAARRAAEEEARKEEARQREAREREEQEKERQKQQEEEAARRAEEEEARKEEEAREREAREREEQEKERQKQQEEAARRAEEEARQREEKARAEEQQRREEGWAEEEEARREGEAMQREAMRREEEARQQEGGEGQPGREWGRRILKTLKA